MSDVPYILSLAYKKEIDEVCKPLANMGMKHAVMYLVFNDGSTSVLSNVYPILKPYYQDELYKEDYTYTEEMMQLNRDHYLCGENKAVSERLKTLLAEKYHIHPTYNLVRHHPECTFVFSAICGAPIDSAEKFYQKTVVNFEKFCIHFVDKFLDLIIKCHPDYKHSFILTNKKLRDSVINRSYIKETNISNRALECLRLAAEGKTAKQIAQHLSISNFTVEQYLKSIRETFHCGSVIEAVVEGIHRGLVGRMNLSHNRRFTPHIIRPDFNPEPC
jgi:DNA-binding CsgD family transcriptional regulator